MNLLLTRLKKTLLQLNFMSYQAALIIFLLVQLVFYSPIFIKGWIINPQAPEFNKENAGTCNPIQRNYTDISRQYIPSIYHQMYSDSKSWLPNWIPNVELGRPFSDAWASKEFLLSNILIRFASDPKQFFTWYVTLNLILGGVFIFLFLQDLELHPWAVLVVSLMYSFSPYFISWQTQPTYIASGIWFFGLLWAVRKFIQRPNWQRGVILSFITYCALYIVRKQSLIYICYILAFYVFLFAIRKISDRQKRMRTLMILSLVVISGAVAYIPSFMDLLENIKNSVRVEGTSDEWLLSYLPEPDTTLKSISLRMHTFFDGYWFGHLHRSFGPLLPVPGESANKIREYSITPLVGFLLLFAFRRKVLRRTLGWLILFAFSTIATYSTPIFLFLAHNLGLGFSRNIPFLWATFVAWVIAAYALDELLNEKRKITWIEIFLMAGVIANGIFVYLNYSEQLSMNYVYFSIFIIFGMLVFIRLRWPVILLFLTFASIYVYSYRQMLWDEPDCYDLETPIAGRIERYTNNETRFAWVHQVPERIIANKEMLFDLQSIHTYDSFASKAYNNLLIDISGFGMNETGRTFLYFKNAKKLQFPAFRLTNIGLLVGNKNPPKGFKVVDKYHGLYFYRPIYEPIPYLNLNKFQLDNSEAIITVPSKKIVSQPVIVLEKKDDFLRLKLNKRKGQSLLFISQQYHSKWFAKNGTGEKLPTVRVNGFYQGVLIPPSTTKVILQYRPWAYFSFVPQTIYVFLGFFLLYSRLKKVGAIKPLNKTVPE